MSSPRVIDGEHPVSPEIAARLAAVGVSEVRDSLMADHIEAPTPLPPDGRRTGLMVRGATHGGSPFLNILSRLTLVVGILVLLGLGYGVTYLARRLVLRMSNRPVAVGSPEAQPQAAPVAAPVGGVPTYQCAPGSLSPADALPAVREAAGVVLGRKTMPRDPKALARVGAQSKRDPSGNRIDYFHPAGADLAVVYSGGTARVSAVSVSYGVPRSPCVALEMAGLLDGPVTFQLRDGESFVPVSGSGAERFFGAGGVARAVFQGPGVHILQLDAPHPAPQ